MFEDHVFLHVILRLEENREWQEAAKVVDAAAAQLSLGLGQYGGPLIQMPMARLLQDGLIKPYNIKQRMLFIFHETFVFNHFGFPLGVWNKQVVLYMFRGVWSCRSCREQTAPSADGSWPRSGAWSPTTPSWLRWSVWNARRRWVWKA